jgi:hypothetical protein
MEEKTERFEVHLGNSLVQCGLAKLSGDVFGYRPDCRNHLLSLFLKKFRVHRTPALARRSSGPPAPRIAARFARLAMTGGATRISCRKRLSQLSV